MRKIQHNNLAQKNAASASLRAVRVMAIARRGTRIVRLFLLGLVLPMGVVLNATAGSGNKYNSVQDLDYGVALYDYFQQDYFNALSELLIAEKTGGIVHHTDFAKVLRGGIHLSYGMEDEARKIFYEIIEDGRLAALGNGKGDGSSSAASISAEGGLLGASKKASEENIARAWFYLGKLLYKKGEFDPAGNNLAKVSSSLSDDLHPEFAFLIDAVGRQSRSAAAENPGALELVNTEAVTELPQPQFKPKIPAGSSWFYYQTFNVLLERIVEHESVVDDAEDEQEAADYYPLNNGVTDDLLAEQEAAIAAQEKAEQQAIAAGIELDLIVAEPVVTDEMPLKRKVKNNVRVARALESLASRVGHSTSLNEANELLALKDKIHTTAGFLYLHLGKERHAVRNFKQVRGESVLVGQALLGYGWAAANKGDYRGAIKPLQVLATRPMLEQTTHEAHLALPYVYEKMEAHTAALEGYDRAATVMQQELELLDKLKYDLQIVEPENLHKYYDRASVKWLEPAASQEAVDKKQLFVSEVLKNRLLKLMTQNRFSMLENQRQDMAWLQTKLNQWEIDLETMRFVIQARQEHSRKAISPKARATIIARTEQFETLRDAFLQKYQSLVEQGDTVEAQAAMASTDQQAIWDRITRAGQRVDKIAGAIQEHGSDEAKASLESALQDTSFAANQTELRWARGLMLWQFAEQDAQRRWALEKNFDIVNSELVSANVEIDNLGNLVAEAERQSTEYQRLTELQQAVTVQNRHAGLLAKELNTQILALLLHDVDRMQQQTQVYLAQARLARARMLDNLSYEDFEVLSDESPSPDTLEVRDEMPLQPLSMNQAPHQGIQEDMHAGMQEAIR